MGLERTSAQLGMAGRGIQPGAARSADWGRSIARVRRLVVYRGAAGVRQRDTLGVHLSFRARRGYRGWQDRSSAARTRSRSVPSASLASAGGLPLDTASGCLLPACWQNLPPARPASSREGRGPAAPLLWYSLLNPTLDRGGRSDPVGWRWTVRRRRRRGGSLPATAAFLCFCNTPTTLPHNSQRCGVVSS